MSDHKRQLVLAQAAWTDLRATLIAYEAAALRDDQQEMQILRERAHELLDCCIDRHGEAATAVRLLIGG